MNRILPKAFISAPQKDRFAAAVITLLNQLLDQTNSFSAVGPTLASGPTITLTSRIHHVSGNKPIKQIIAPSDYTGGDIILIPDGAWTVVTGGNIGRAFTATLNIPVHAVFDGTQWWLK